MSDDILLNVTPPYLFEQIPFPGVHILEGFLLGQPSDLSLSGLGAFHGQKIQSLYLKAILLALVF